MRTILDEKNLSRLSFLKAGGALVIAFSMPLSLMRGAARAAGAGTGAFAAFDPAQLDSWLAVGPDGTVTIFMGKVELGMGTTTGLTQSVAEELDVSMTMVTLIIGDTELTPNQGGTWDSNATNTGGPPLRQWPLTPVMCSCNVQPPS